GGTTYFQPVNEILQVYSLTLMTGGSTTPPSTTSRPPTSPTSTSQPPGGTTWAPGRYYAAGTTVTYNGVTYRCWQSHTSQSGWEPPNVPALWQRV
ncbi:MAG TPA: carbohydrate-binding protein, partial [Pilimelia sp.]|nr:carbohydrate-binding protein [Pilimelia sp.]